MTVSYEQVLMVIGGASTIATSVFWGAYALGKLMSRMERIETRIEQHDELLERLARR